MFRYQAGSLENALQEAALDLNVEVDEVYYVIKNQSDSEIEIDVYTILDVERFVKQYLENYLANMYLRGQVKTKINQEQVIVDLDCENNSILIGKNGQALRALVIITRNVVQHHFKKRFEVIIDINGYKERRYQKIIQIAERIAQTVQQTKINATLDPMPNDERKMIHQALTRFENIRTESEGFGKDRHLTLIYDESKEK